MAGDAESVLASTAVLHADIGVAVTMMLC